MSILVFNQDGIHVTTSSWTVGSNTGDKVVIFYLWGADAQGKIDGRTMKHATLPITLDEFWEAVTFPKALGAYIDINAAIEKARKRRGAA